MNILKNLKTVIFIVILFSLGACQGKNNVTGSGSGADGGKAQAFEGDSIQRVVGVGIIVPQDLITQLAVQSSGVITEIYKHEGENLKTGDIILKLDDTDEMLNLRKLKAQRQTQEYELRSSKAAIGESQVSLSREEDRLKTAVNLVRNGAVTKESVDDLKTQVETRRLELEQKKESYEAAKSRIDEISIEISQAEETLSKKTLRAPADGIVLHLFVPQFSTVSAYQEVASFAPAGPVIARCEIDEMYAGKVHTGEKAEIRNIGFSRIIGTGTVIQTSPYLKQKSLFIENTTDPQDSRVREVRIRIDNPSGLLFNSRVECSISTD